MATNINDLWVTASMDSDVELQETLMAEARLEAAQYWSVLASAENPADFKNRMALIKDQLSAVAAKVTEGEVEGAYPVVLARLLNDLEDDFRTVHQARKQKEAARIARGQAHAAKLQREVLAELSKEANTLYDSLSDCIRSGHHLESVDDDGYCNNCGHQEKSATRKHATEQCENCGKPATQYVGGQEGYSASGHNVCDSCAKRYTSSRKHSIDDGGGVGQNWKYDADHGVGTTADPSFLAAPAEGQGTPPSTEGTPGSNAGDDSSASGEDLDESNGPNQIDDSVIVNGKRIARFQTEAANFTRQHFNHVAEGIRTAPVDEETREALAKHFAEHLAGTNANFNKDRFVGASTHTASRHFLADSIGDYPGTRAAKVNGGASSLEQVQAYMPSNYHASQDADGQIWISGHDEAGWTLDGYVIPRLQSGLISATEIPESAAAFSSTASRQVMAWSGHTEPGEPRRGPCVTCGKDCNLSGTDQCPDCVGKSVHDTLHPRCRWTTPNHHHATASRKTAFGDPVGYVYEADVHCPNCAEKRWGRGADGFIGSDSTDSEGNSVGAIAPWDEGTPWGEYCGDCGAEITPPNGMDTEGSRKVAVDRENHNWDTNEVALHFANDYGLYQATRGGTTAEDVEDLWINGNYNDSVSVGAVDWQAVADEINEEEE